MFENQEGKIYFAPSLPELEEWCPGPE